MLATPSDQAVAYKVISLLPELSKSDARVCATIIAHYNRNTGQCNPSIDRLAELLKIDQRTVKRAIKRLSELGLINKEKGQRNSRSNWYAPNWSRFWELEKAWNIHFNDLSKPWVTTLSSSGGQGCHAGGGANVTQTQLINPIKKTQHVDVGDSHDTSSELHPSNGQGKRSEFQTQSDNLDQGKRRRRRNYNRPQHIADILSDIMPTEFNVVECEQGNHKFNNSQNSENKFYSPEPTVKRLSFAPATNRRKEWCDSAESRWVADVRKAYGGDIEGYFNFLQLIDDEVRQKATDAECDRRGGGLKCVLHQLKKWVASPNWTLGPS